VALDRRRWDNGESPRLWPERIVCAAELATARAALSGVSSAAGMTPQLAGELARQGVWSVGRVLRYLAEQFEPGSWQQVVGVTLLAPLVPSGLLATMDDVLEAALRYQFEEYLAAAVAAWALRLATLGHVADALAAPLRLPKGHPRRGFVAVWAYAELIAYLPDAQAALALREALVRVARSDQADISYAACQLTKCVPVGRAVALWNLVGDDAVPQDLRPAVEAYRAGGRPTPVALLLHGLLGPARSTEPNPFLADTTTFQNPRLLEHGFVAAARWLPGEVAPTMRAAFAARDVSRSSVSVVDDLWSHTRRVALLPGLLYDGVLSVLPGDLVGEALEWVRDLLSGQDRLACLAQLLPLVDGERRRAIAEEIFQASTEDFEGLARAANLPYAAVPALAAGGAIDGLVDRISKTRSLHGLIPVHVAPLLDREGVRRLLDPASGVTDPYYRNALLARWASFGRAQAQWALDEAYAVEPPGELAGLLRAFLPAGHGAPDARAKRLRAWWLAAGGVNSGTAPSSWRPPTDGPYADVAAELAALGADPIDSDLLDLAMDLSTRMQPDLVPVILDSTRRLANPWPRLVRPVSSTGYERARASASSAYFPPMVPGWPTASMPGRRTSRAWSVRARAQPSRISCSMAGTSRVSARHTIRRCWTRGPRRRSPSRRCSTRTNSAGSGPSHSVHSRPSSTAAPWGRTYRLASPSATPRPETRTRRTGH
jgi:hypothetical protein